MNFTPSKELRLLIDSSLDGTISATEMIRLESLLQDPAALEFYFSIVSNEALLPSALEARSQFSNKILRPRIQFTLIGLAASLAFLVGLIIPSPLDPSPTLPVAASSSTSDAATITSIVSAVWENNSPPSLEITPNSPAISLKSGLMELTFASGVRTIIEGPASIKVDGRNEASMQAGRLVADVPKGAEGFTVNYAAGKVVDLGTEFSLYIAEDSPLAEVGVFKGEVEIYNANDSSPIRITQNQAMRHGGEGVDAYRSIPFDHQAYIRDIPSHEFKWSLDPQSDSPVETLEFDVSHLVWRSGSHRAIMKWMSGNHAVSIHQMELLFNGAVVSTDSHMGKTGLISKSHNNTYSNTYQFHIAEESRKKGKWALRVTVSPDIGSNKASKTNSSGVLLFEDSLSIQASEKDFIGVWKYSFDGDEHQRHFYPDHTAAHFVNGIENPGYHGAAWDVSDGILTIQFPPSSRNPDELHVLRNHQVLIFVNQPYHNAQKLED